MKELYDVIIVGAGPAGCACAYQLSGKGLKIAVVEKGAFPKDKICGDGLSPDVLNQLKTMGLQLYKTFESDLEKCHSEGIRIVAPNASTTDISLLQFSEDTTPLYISKRIDFDQFLYDQIKNLPDVDIFLNHPVVEIQYEEDSVCIKTDARTFNGQMVLGADGAHSRVKKHLSNNKFEKQHHYAGLRQYFENVDGLFQNYIELHFYDDLLPGYFWIFPLADNRANVGVIMLSDDISKYKINLKEKLKELINHHPELSKRFSKAKPLENIKGFGLPIGSKKRALSGDRFLLLGDAADLIFPFTGEGIVNAIRCGRVAAEHVLKGMEQQRFDTDFNKAYDKKIKAKMGHEMKSYKLLQDIFNYKWAANFLIKKARKNESIQLIIVAVLNNNINLKKYLFKPSFYFKLIFT